MSDALTFGVIAAVGVSSYALIRVPGWLFASMNRGTLWNLRDCVFDARRSGHLPRATEVQELLDRIEGMILVLPRTSALQIRWLVKRGHVTAPDRPVTLKLHDGRPDQQRLFQLVQDELRRIVVRHYLLCSWSGLLFVAPRHSRDVRRVLERRIDIQEWLDTTDFVLATEADWALDVYPRYEQIVVAVEQVADLRDDDDDDRALISAA